MGITRINLNWYELRRQPAWKREKNILPCRLLLVLSADGDTMWREVWTFRNDNKRRAFMRFHTRCHRSRVHCIFKSFSSSLINNLVIGNSSFSLEWDFEIVKVLCLRLHATRAAILLYSMWYILTCVVWCLFWFSFSLAFDIVALVPLLSHLGINRRFNVWLLRSKLMFIEVTWFNPIQKKHIKSRTWSDQRLEKKWKSSRKGKPETARKLLS